MKPGFGVERFRTLKKSVGSWWGGYIDFELDMVTVFQILYYFVFWSLKEHQCFLAGPKGQLSKLLLWLPDWWTPSLTEADKCKYLTSRPARALKLSRLSQHGLRTLPMDFLIFGTMSGPCLDHVGTMFGLALLPDQLEHWIFQGWVNMV